MNRSLAIGSPSPIPFNNEYPEMTCSCLPITVVVLVRDVAETPLVRHPTARSVAFVVCVVVVVAIARAPGRLARAVVVVSSVAVAVAFAVAVVARGGAAGSLGAADEGGTVIARRSHHSRVRVSRRRVRRALFRFDSTNACMRMRCTRDSNVSNACIAPRRSFLVARA